MRDEGRRVKHSEEKLMYSTGDYRVTDVCLCVCVCVDWTCSADAEVDVLLQ